MQTFEKVLEELEEAAEEKDEVSIGDVREKIGPGSFGTALFVFGLILLSPIGGIPGAPTLFGLFFVLIAGQLVIGEKSFWLPRFLLKRSVEGNRLKKAVEVARPPTRFVGKAIRSRLTFLTRGIYARAIGGIVLLLAISLPPLEIVPFGAALPAFAITAFGLALVAGDGLLAALALAATGGTAYLLTTLL